MPAESSAHPFLPISCRFLEWISVFFLIQQVERFFLFLTASSLTASPPSVILQTFMSCVPQDLEVSVGLSAGGAFLAVLLSLFSVVTSSTGARTVFMSSYVKWLGRSSAFIAVVLVALLMVDASYYRFSQQHLNFVFFEYVADLFGDFIAHTSGSQAAEQTSAVFDMKEVYLAAILIFLEGLVFWAWTSLFSRLIDRMGAVATRPYRFSTVSVGLLVMLFLMGAVGKASQTQLMPLEEAGDALFSLAQNAVLSTNESARAALFHQLEWRARFPGSAISEEEAVSGYQRARGQMVAFPSQRYPLVGQRSEATEQRFKDPLNVLVIFVEGLDRRYLNRTVQAGRPILITPFFDQLQRQSVSFNNFFANGVQTSRGLFSTLCSYYPRHGSAAIKTRSDREYLCLPSVLRERGYRTEMVVGQSGTINNLREFFSKNGINKLYDEHDFPPGAQRMGLGMTDGAMFDFVTDRIREAQHTKEPFFLTTLTLSTHHPFVFPTVHPEVNALLHEEDRYIPALRYFDSEFERFFTTLQEEGLLKNTIVFVLGDHGRHEPEGKTDQEREIGHFMAPLIVWLDESLHSPERFVPRSVDVITSQVDIAPTILAMVGMGREPSPFAGRDLSCLFIGECLNDNMAYLTSVYDDLIGLATKDKIWLYSFRKAQLSWTDLSGRSMGLIPKDERDAHWEYRRMIESYVASNILLEQNRIWPMTGVGVCCKSTGGQVATRADRN